MGVAPIKMPQLGESVTEGTVDKWLKKEGDFVKRDEPIVEVVTDKVNAEIPSPFEGRLLRISVDEGQTVAVGVEIAQIETEAATASPPEAGPAPVPPAAGTGTTAPAQASAQATPAPSGDDGAGTTQEIPSMVGAAPAGAAGPAGRPRFSPAVRRLAEEHGIDPSSIPGSGDGGRVTRDDVLAHVAGQGTMAAASNAAAPGAGVPVQPPPVAATAEPAAAVAGAAAEARSQPVPPAAAAQQAPPAPAAIGDREELVKLSAMRRSIAEHMVRSLATSPHAWTLQEVDVTELVRFRESEKEGFRARNGVPLTYLPFVTQVVCAALQEFPLLNSSWTDQGVVVKRYVNMGYAVAIPDGLIVPVLRDADRAGFTDLARTIHDLVERARGKQLKPDDVQAGTFTLNNTGSTGSIASQPIINQPQAAILTTEAIVRRPVVIGEGIAVRHMMNMCLSFDHRIIDGMIAGQFLGSVKSQLEAWTPASLRL